jgi:hypothetical protein
MAVYTFIQDNTDDITVEVVKSYCRIDNDDYDTALGFMLDGVKAQADAYCQSNFTDEGGVVPALVKLWILKACLAIYERPNMHSIREDVWESGSGYWEFEWDKYIEDLKPFRREPGFA